MFVKICIPWTHSEFFRFCLYGYSECPVKSAKGSYHESWLPEDSRCGKLVSMIHISDSTPQIASWRPKKNHGAWYSTYIYRHALHFYFQEDLQVCWGMEWLLSILSQNVTQNSYSDAIPKAQALKGEWVHTSDINMPVTRHNNRNLNWVWIWCVLSRSLQCCPLHL